MSINFKNKTYTGKIRSVQRFIKSIGMSHTVSTQIAQKDHKETEEKSHPFIRMMWNKVSGMDPDYVVNKDSHTILLSCIAYLGEEGSKDGTCPVFNYGHKMSNTCGNSVSKWEVFASYADFQGKPGG